MDYIIVQAGGKGTRLKYLTENKPKALVPIDNLPMLFHLFRKYPNKRFVIIADYKKEVMREYLDVFADVKYQMVDANGEGTCSGIKQAVDLIPEHEPFLLVWSDLVLPTDLRLPDGYEDGTGMPAENYIGLSQTFLCRWKYENGEFAEEASKEFGVAGFFLFREKSEIVDVPGSGELVRWMQQKQMRYGTVGLAGTREFGLIEEYEKLEQVKCRPFNRILTELDEKTGKKILVKEAIDPQGEKLAERECAWYKKAGAMNIQGIPHIYETNPLKMELIDGKNIYEYSFDQETKKKVLVSLIGLLRELHASDNIEADSFSLHEAYFNKTMDRLAKIEDLVPFARDREIRINGKWCRNIFFHKRELENKLQRLIYNCDKFTFIHGDCTFSNMMLRANGMPVLIDPRGYFGFSELYGDERYDWAKVYYSIAGNYDQFNRRLFSLNFGAASSEGISLAIKSNNWEDMEEYFFELTGTDQSEIKLLHAVIWLSLTTYTWQDYDSVCGAFYNGLWYLEDVL